MDQSDTATYDKSNCHKKIVHPTINGLQRFVSPFCSKYP